MTTQDGPQSLPPSQPKSKGDIYESLAFTFCKAATIILLTQKFALPVAAGGAAIFYLLSSVHGKTDTRCIGRKPLLIASFWGAVCLLSLYLKLRHMLTH